MPTKYELRVQTAQHGEKGAGNLDELLRPSLPADYRDSVAVVPHSCCLVPSSGIDYYFQPRSQHKHFLPNFLGHFVTGTRKVTNPSAHVLSKMKGGWI